MDGASGGAMSLVGGGDGGTIGGGDGGAIGGGGGAVAMASPSSVGTYSYIKKSK